ncbi:MAG: hypothetical protein QOF60_1058 [Actinomycetota bacterium]|jgi:hypothetical protein|nr:hypothetical protein [Actinomycetota bacterium]
MMQRLTLAAADAGCEDLVDGRVEARHCSAKSVDGLFICTHRD